MARFYCSKCGIVRSKGKGELCPICWLVAELLREHLAGEHDDRVNSSCITCTRLSPVTPPLPESSHVNCEHPNTKVARTRCRYQRRKNNS